MSTSTASEPRLTPVKFSRLSRRGVLLGLSPLQLVMAGFGAASLVLGLYVGAVFIAVPVIGVCVALGFVSVGGRKLVEWGPIGLTLAMAFRRRSTRLPPQHRPPPAFRHFGAAR